MSVKEKLEVPTAKKNGAKIYHLLSNGKSSIEQYQRVSKSQRVRIDARKNDRPFLVITFTDEGGVNKTIRFKLNCNEIDRAVQVEKYKIPANEKFTNAERRMLEFKNGVLVVTNEVAKNFLDNHPQNENFKGDCPDIQERLFKEYDPTVVKKNEVADIRKRTEAANKILDMDLKEAQDTLRRLYGGFYTVPEELEDCVTELINFLDSANEEGINALMSDGTSLADEVSILISKALKAGVLSFEEPGMENFVIKKKGGQIIPVKEISGNLPMDERRRYFIDFLTSTDGRLLLEDLRKEFPAEKKKKAEVPVK